MASEGLVVSEEWGIKKKAHNQRKMSIPQNIMNWSASRKMQRQNKFVRHSERKHWRNIPIREVTLKSSRNYQALTKYYVILKRDNCMMTMGNKVFKMEGDLELEEWEISFRCLEWEEVEKEILGQRKVNQGLLKLMWLLLKYLVE